MPESTSFRTCAASGEQFRVYPDDLDFYDKTGVYVQGKLFSLPPPKLCPRERLRRRLAFRNERFLYRNSCSVSGVPIISVFAPERGYRVAESRRWRELDNREFGREFDFNRPFFDQFFELYRDTYKPHVIATGEVINSEYAHFAGWVKNCYLTFDIGHSEDCMYSVDVGRSRNCVDCYIALHSELCYESVKIVQCYNVVFGLRSKNCRDSAFIDDCIGCSNCIGCVGLRNQQYCVFNKKVSEAEFDAIRSKVFDGTQRSLAAFQAEFARFAEINRRITDFNVNSEDSTGSYLENCTNVRDSINCFEARDLRYCRECFFNATNSYDVNNWGEQMQFCYELSGCGGQKGKAELNNCLFSMYIFYGGYEVIYSINCTDVSKHLFGCADLVKGEYCILNKQYSPEEYNKLLPRIITHMRETGEWGEYFPISCSPFGYNESLAAEYFSLDQQEVESVGGRWVELPVVSSDSSLGEVSLDQSVFADEIERTFRCRVSGRAYRILENELRFYQSKRLPIPDRCFQQRHIERRTRLYSE